MHQVQLVVKTSEHLRHCGSVSDHANRKLDFCKVAAGDDDRQLVIDADLESAAQRARSASHRPAAQCHVRGNNHTTLRDRQSKRKLSGPSCSASPRFFCPLRQQPSTPAVPGKRELEISLFAEPTDGSSSRSRSDPKPGSVQPPNQYRIRKSCIQCTGPRHSRSRRASG
jgi:hypothetical protein